MYLVTGNTIPGFTPHPNPTTRPGDALLLQLLMMTFLRGWEQSFCSSSRARSTNVFLCGQLPLKTYPWVHRQHKSGRAPSLNEDKK